MSHVDIARGRRAIGAVLRLTAIFAALALSAGSAPQQNGINNANSRKSSGCVKGKRCGNSCIAVSKRCHK